jgi:hypothetical protein
MLRGVFLQGEAPSIGSFAFFNDNSAIAYRRLNTTSWSNNAVGLPAVLWNPQAQMSESIFNMRTDCFGFTITGTTNIPVVVDASTNLGSGNWTALDSVSLTNGSFYFSDPQWTNYPGRFYRLRSP